MTVQAAAADEAAVRAMYHALLDAWNRRDGDGFAACFAEDGDSIGFDGSQMKGRGEIATVLRQIFAGHLTGSYVAAIKSLRFLAPDVALLQAAAGMAPHGQPDLPPQLNALQILVAVKSEGQWRIALFQNTPAQYHGRPELVQQMTEELRRLR